MIQKNLPNLRQNNIQKERIISQRRFGWKYLYTEKLRNNWKIDVFTDEDYTD
jgi:hypothetical protein